jgi:hypothetical protein
MKEDQQDQLSEEESGALRSLQSGRLPPPQMEERVIAALKNAGLLRANPGRRWWRSAAALAACLALFMAGVAVGARLVTSPAQPEPAGERFVLFLYEGAGYQASAPGTERERIAEYGAWARDLRKSGELVAGEKLKVGEQVLGSAVVPAGTAGAYPGMRPGTLGGFFIIAARDPKQAREIASTCPHLRHGGSIVIRQIDPV